MTTLLYVREVSADIRDSNILQFKTHDVVFVRCVVQNECSKRTGIKHGMEQKNGSLKHANELEREVSSAHFVRIYTFRIRLTNACE